MNLNFISFVKELFISKKIILFLLVAFTFVACKKCQDCTCDNVTEEVCEDDFDSNSDYNAAILVLEDLGCDCN